MITTDAIATIKSRLRVLGTAPTPQAGVAQMVIRSGDQLFFRAPMRSKLTRFEKDQLLGNLDPTSTDPADGDDDEPSNLLETWDKAKKKALLGLIVAEFGYDIVRQSDGEKKFQTFLRLNERALAELAPRGVRYRGTYVVNHTTEKSAGDYRTIWSFRSVAALNRIGATVRGDQEISVFGALMKRFREYVDDSPGTGKSQQVYQIAWGTVRGF